VNDTLMSEGLRIAAYVAIVIVFFIVLKLPKKGA